MDITRETLDDVRDDIDVRLYTQGDSSLPSVTTILKTREDDKSNLHDWQDRNNGQGNNADYQHLFWYSRHVGTLGHWYALKNLDPTLAWTEDEASSLWALKNVNTLTDDSDYRFQSEKLDTTVVVNGKDHRDIHDASPREVLYSVLRGDRDKAGGTVSTWGEFYDKYGPYHNHTYYSEAILDTAERDVGFFEDAQKRLWSKLGVTQESAIGVEQYLFNLEHGYAGQVDLVYEDGRGNVVVADLKSSSGCYDKHQIQGAAYGKAVSQAGIVDSVDRLEVHRAHPRTGQMAVHTHRDAPGKQPIHTTKYWDDSYQTLWEQFEKLASDFEYSQ